MLLASPAVTVTAKTAGSVSESASGASSKVRTTVVAVAGKPIPSLVQPQPTVTVYGAETTAVPGAAERI